MRICVYEDEAVGRLDPLALTRPACDLWCGASPLLDRHRRHFGAGEAGLLVRPALADWARYLHPDLAVNDPVWLRGGPAVLVNARWLPPGGPPAAVPDTPAVALAGRQVAYVVAPPLDGDELSWPYLAGKLAAWQQTLPAVDAGGRLLDYPWDMVEANPAAVAEDARRHRGPKRAGRPPAEVTGPEELLIADAEAEIEPRVVADTRRGPVLIGRGAVVESFSRLEGPCYVGPDCRVLGARLRASSLGPGCRVGGEVEASVFQGYANKAHDGFLGHSYVGAWVNLAAGTQAGDLRNDYAPVRAPVAGGRVDTGLLKVGAFLGDYTRTGVGALLNAGTSAGPFCHLLPWAGLLPRDVPSFCAFAFGRLRPRADLRRMFDAAAAAMRRRGTTWTDAHAEFFLSLYEQTAGRRREAVAENDQRRLRRDLAG